MVRETAGIVRVQLASEWPDWIWLPATELVKVGKTLDTHVTNVLADLGKFGMRSFEGTLVSGKADVGVVDWLEEIESVWVALESMETKHVSRCNTVSVELQSHRGGWN